MSETRKGLDTRTLERFAREQDKAVRDGINYEIIANMWPVAGILRDAIHVIENPYTDEERIIRVIIDEEMEDDLHSEPSQNINSEPT